MVMPRMVHKSRTQSNNEFNWTKDQIPTDKLLHYNRRYIAKFHNSELKQGPQMYNHVQPEQHLV